MKRLPAKTLLNRNERRMGKCVLIVPLILASLTHASVYAGSLATSADVPNIAPTVDAGLTPDNDPAPGVQIINPDTKMNKTVVISANVTDMNGYGDIVSVTANITGPGVVVDSPVSLSFDTAVNVTTARYKGKFNMSNHSEGDYEVEITATDSGELTGVGSTSFIYLYALQPDTVITSLSLSANPKTIKADGISNSTITACLRNNGKLAANGTLVDFSTTLGTLSPALAYTINGRTTPILTSSIFAGTAVVSASSGGVSATTLVVIENITSTTANKTVNSTTVTVGNSSVIANVTIQNGTVIINTGNAGAANNTANNATAGSTISSDIGGGAKLVVTLEKDVICENTTVFTDISSIRWDNPPNTYQTRAAGNSTVDLDVRFIGSFTPENLKFTLNQRDCIDDAAEFVDADASTIKNNLIAAFGISGVSHSDIDNNTTCIVHAELSGTNLSPEDIKEVPITITVSKDWFNVVAGGKVSNVRIFEFNDTTGIVEEIKNVTKVNETNTAITFDAGFSGLSLFALLSEPTAGKPTPSPTYVYHKGGGHPLKSDGDGLGDVDEILKGTDVTSIEIPTLAPTFTPSAIPTQTPTPTPVVSVPRLRLPPLFLILIAIAIIIIIASTIIMMLRRK